MTKDIKQIQEENRRYILELKKVKAENRLLKERLRIGYKEPKFNANRENVIKYKKENPNASIREIQKALKLSSTRLVTYYLEKNKIELLTTKGK